MKALTKIKGLDQVSVVIFNCARGLTNCKCVNFYTIILWQHVRVLDFTP